MQSVVSSAPPTEGLCLFDIIEEVLDAKRQAAEGEQPAQTEARAREWLAALASFLPALEPALFFAPPVEGHHPERLARLAQFFVQQLPQPLSLAHATFLLRGICEPLTRDSGTAPQIQVG